MVSGEKLDLVLVEAVDHVLHCLSAACRPTIYDRLSSGHRMRRQDIPRRLEDFHVVLTDVLGTGAQTVERLIAQELYRKLGLTFIGPAEWRLADYVENAKKQMASSSSEECAPEAVAGSEETS